MASTPSIEPSAATPPQRTAGAATGGVVVCLPSLPTGALHQALAAVSAAFPGETVRIVTPDHIGAENLPPGLETLPYPTDRSAGWWVLTAGDYDAAGNSAESKDAAVTLLLGELATTLQPDTIRRMANAVRSERIDLVLPRFTFEPGEGLVNFALLYPLSRALFTTDILFPLPAAAAVSGRAAQRLAASARRFTASGQSQTLLWPVGEAAIAGFSVREADAGKASPPQPEGDDFNTIFASVVSSLFADVEAKATFWQRARSTSLQPTVATTTPVSGAELPGEVTPMVEAFRLAYGNLQEIWSLVLPPQTLLPLKRLSQSSPEHFSMAPAIWARVVYDFALAFHLRTLNRGHLIGSLTPIYLAWVASYLCNSAGSEHGAQQVIAETAAAFERERAYLVSRWRWPDRFNP